MPTLKGRFNFKHYGKAASLEAALVVEEVEEENSGSGRDEKKSGDDKFGYRIARGFTLVAHKSSFQVAFLTIGF